MRITALATRFGLRRPWTAKHPRRQENNRTQQFKNAANRDSHDPKRQQNQPHNRIKNQRQKRQRPADHKQQAPKQERQHHSPPSAHTSIYAKGSAFVSLRRRSWHVLPISRAFDLAPTPCLRDRNDMQNRKERHQERGHNAQRQHGHRVSGKSVRMH